MSSSDAGNAFSKVQPYCVDFIRKHDLPSLERLHRIIRELDKDALEEIALYILFPFRVLLKRQDPKHEDLTMQALKCISYVFSSVTIEDWVVVNELLTELCKIITNQKDNDLGATGSEELKESVASALGNLLDHASFSVRHSLYHYSNVPLLGHAVTLLLSIASDNIDKDARIVALTALKSLCEPSYCSLLDESSHHSIKASIGDCMACYLPGISARLSKVIVTDTAAGHKVKASCMDVLATFIVATVGDDSPRSKQNDALNNVNPRLRSIVVSRDEKWISTVADKLQPIIENVCSASNSDNWSIRFHCVKFCGKLLLQCRKNMANHANTLLKVPVKLLNDNYAQVQQLCSKILDDFSSCLREEESGSRILVEILEENLFALCTSLPRLLRTTQDAEKLSTLKIVLGYLTLLKERVLNFLLSLPHLKKLTNALLHSLELDLSSIQLMDLVSSSIHESEFNHKIKESCFRKQFKHFRDMKIYEVLCQICNVLGQYGDLEILLDNFLDIYSTSESHCKQAVIVLNQILIGAKCSKEIAAEKFEFGVKTLLGEFLSPENWYLVTNYDSEYLKTHHPARMQKLHSSDQKMSLVPVRTSASYSDHSIKLLKSNSLLCCLHLEAVLTFSNVLDTDFRSHLMHALYPLLEKTTDPDSSISGCAVRAMHGVAINCGYRSSSELIAKNADYLISDISIQIHRLETFPRCPAVLQAMLDHSDADILPLVSDTVDEILTALDLHHLEPQKLLVFIPVLLSVVKAIRRWIPEQSCQNNGGELGIQTEHSNFTQNQGQTFASKNCSMRKKEDPGVFKRMNSGSPEVKETRDIQNEEAVRKHFIENLRSHLLDLHKNKKIATLEEDPEIDPNWKPKQEEDEQYQHPLEEEKKKPPPMEIQVTTKVLSRCIHLMAHRDPRIRMRVMDVVEAGMTVLRSQENELLPMAHKLWSPLVTRFGDEELQVVMKAFNTVCTVAEHSKDFLRKRFCKEILPKLLSVLEYQAKYSLKLSKTTSNFEDSTILLPQILPQTRESIAYTHSMAFKLQKKVLRGLGPLLKDLDIRRSDHLSVCQACIPYLSSKQPHQLQEATLELFQNLNIIDSDMTWLQLTGVWCPTAVIKPPKSLSSNTMGKNLQPCYLGGSTDPGNEFANNIEKLLNDC